MEVTVHTNKLAKQLSRQRERVRNFGFNRAVQLKARLDDLLSVRNLSEVSRFPPARLHRLSGDKRGLFAVDISANYRLVFAGFDADHNQSTDVFSVVSVMIFEIEDYH